MDIILLEKVDRLGKLGDVVSVKNGFARNFLLPFGKAKIANEANVKELEERRAEFEAKEAETLATATALKAKLDEMTISITSKSGSEGKLFGSVGNADIAEAIVAAGVDIEKKVVRLPTGPIRNAGEYEIDLHLHSDVNAQIKLTIIGEE
ncbi:MAG: 50S ribosomal protein L9 [endosymbiont of Galathealinum brachiosum]|uniref:Large ribosomal subunit protein bL9 n=1 Tax=endosymbiont of Galathealinum brachiosum TaxID=2200906 RepID=A0A370DK38_9GAMM|nr:MAG: 50S ribosomal protein L9 [endosymbiont of Galathealinum brachiosum]